MAQIFVTVLELDIACPKCKTKVLKAVASIEGVDKVVTDVAKGMMEVTGTADSCFITKRVRKALCCAGKTVKVVKVGPPPKPDGEKKPNQKKPDPCPCSCPCPCPTYNRCSYGYIVEVPETNAPCSIL